MTRQGKARERTLENVKNFWDKEADEWGDNPCVTIRDHYFRLLEIETICGLVKGRDHVFDIGCGSGFSTLFYSQFIGRIIGADYSESMVKCAQRFLTDREYYEKVMEQYSPDTKPVLKDNIRFEQGNIIDLRYPPNTFDAVIAERVLINLPAVEMQDEAVTQVARVLKPGGIWMVVEVIKQGHSDVDRLRKKFGLKILEKYWHNLYVDETHFISVADRVGLSVREIRRFETYQFLTKVIHPMVVAPDEPKFMSGFNMAARIISRDYPNCGSVMKIGLEKFLQEDFRVLLIKHDPEKLDGYDKLVPDVLRETKDFSQCSHQVLYVLDRN